MLYLKIDDAKTVFFDFAVNKHGVLSTDINNQVKKLNIVAVVEKEFIKYFMVIWMRMQRVCM
jgi:hypothetical protein